jgi:hypothetical protein
MRASIWPRICKTSLITSFVPGRFSRHEQARIAPGVPRGALGIGHQSQALDFYTNAMASTSVVTTGRQMDRDS